MRTRHRTLILMMACGSIALVATISATLSADQSPTPAPSQGGTASATAPTPARALVTDRYKEVLPAAVAVGLVVLAVDLRVPVFGAVAADEPAAAYAAIRGEGRLLELPVFRPDVHFGSAFLGYARQSPRERPQGYSTVAPRAARRLARELRGLSCGRGRVPPELGIRFVVVHRGLYDASGFFAPPCADRAEAALRAAGWRVLARHGPIAAYGRR